MEQRARRYWGLRPRREVRRVIMVVIAGALLAVIAYEALWMLRRGS